MLTPGTVVGGYRIESFIAAGGMGAVYRATQLSLQREVALKLLSEGLSGDPTFRARFRREARLQATLEHPHIVPVYEAGEDPEGLYIAMRLLPGSSLDRLTGTIPRREALTLLAGVAAALDAAHAAGLIHRDVKPQNILVSDQHAYLADFGLTTATGLSSMTSQGQFIGTVDYIAPEQIRDEQPGPASDVYSLGAVLHHCLTGSVPFPRGTKVAVIYAQLEQEPEPVTALAPELPAELDAIVASALAKDPAARPTSAAALISAAREALGSGAAAEAPARPPEGVVAARQSTTTAETRLQRQRTPAAATAAAPAVRARAVRQLPGGRGRLTVLIAAVMLAAVGGAAGFLARRATSHTPAPAPTRRLTAREVSVAVPRGWTTRTGAVIPQLFAKQFAAAGPRAIPGAAVVVGLSRGFGPSMVPSPLRSIPGVPQIGPVRRTRSGLVGRLYRFSSPALRYEILFVPTRHLVATVACVAPARGADAGVMRQCERIIGTMRDPHASRLDPRPAYAQFLSSVLSALSMRRSRGITALGGASAPAARASAAAGVAAAYSAAEARFTRLIGHGVTSPELGLHDGLRNQLRACAGAYRTLAHAESGGDAAAIRSAASAAHAEDQNLSIRLYQLNKGGYSLSQ